MRSARWLLAACLVVAATVAVADGPIELQAKRGHEVTTYYGELVAVVFDDLNGNGIWNRLQEPALNMTRLQPKKVSWITFQDGQRVEMTFIDLDGNGVYNPYRGEEVISVKRLPREGFRPRSRLGLKSR